MGNSNATHFAPNDMVDLRGHRNSGNHHWQHLNPNRASFQPQSIKVLPELKEHSRLRATNNGIILQSGGTISGRRESVVGIHRSKSISSPQHEMRYKVGLQRHNTQLDMAIDRRLQHEMEAKRFGSEPDLRFTDEVNQHMKKLNSSKKIKAPNIPIKHTVGQQQQHRPEYDATRFGWRPKHQEPQMEPPQQQTQQYTKKLRLFKTKDESKKKVSSKANTSKLATEASDVHFRKHPIMDRRNKYSRDSRPANGK